MGMAKRLEGTERRPFMLSSLHNIGRIYDLLVAHGPHRALAALNASPDYFGT